MILISLIALNIFFIQTTHNLYLQLPPLPEMLASYLQLSTLMSKWISNSKVQNQANDLSSQVSLPQSFPLWKWHLFPSRCSNLKPQRQIWLPSFSPSPHPSNRRVYWFCFQSVSQILLFSLPPLLSPWTKLHFLSPDYCNCLLPALLTRAGFTNVWPAQLHGGLHTWSVLLSRAGLEIMNKFILNLCFLSEI